MTMFESYMLELEKRQWAEGITKSLADLLERIGNLTGRIYALEHPKPKPSKQERVILRSRDGLEMATKVPRGVRYYRRPLAPAASPIREPSMAPGFDIRVYEDRGTTRSNVVSTPGGVKLRILEEQ